MKEKYWTHSFDRSGPKTKSMEWFSSQTPAFRPSVFVGVQFPGGVNLKFKYYLVDFLNTDYKIAGNSQEENHRMVDYDHTRIHQNGMKEILCNLSIGLGYAYDKHYNYCRNALLNFEPEYRFGITANGLIWGVVFARVTSASKAIHNSLGTGILQPVQAYV